MIMLLAGVSGVNGKCSYTKYFRQAAFYREDAELVFFHCRRFLGNKCKRLLKTEDQCCLETSKSLARHGSEVKFLSDISLI